jgi:YVTN family beta-propeller protein
MIRVVTLGVVLLLAPIGGLSCGSSASDKKPAAPARIYVSNQLDNTASVFDGATRKTIATVRVGVSPAQMAVAPDRKSVYIANTGSDSVSVLDTARNTITGTIALPPRSRPIDVAASPGGRYLYTADGGTDHVSAIDVRASRVVASVRVGSQPLSVAVSPDGGTVYAANSGSGDVSVIDAHRHRVTRTIPAGRFPSGVAVTPDGASLYVTGELSGVTVINAGDGSVAATLPTPSPFSVAVSTAGDHAYVTSLGPGGVTAIDTGTRRVTSSVSVGPAGTDPFTVRAAGDAIYVTNQGANTLSVIDRRTFKVTATLATGTSPYGVAVLQPTSRRQVARSSTMASRTTDQAGGEP